MSTKSFYQKEFLPENSLPESELRGNFLTEEVLIKVDQFVYPAVLVEEWLNANRCVVARVLSKRRASFSRHHNDAFDSRDVVIRASISPDSPAKSVNHPNQASCFEFGKRDAVEEGVDYAKVCALAVGSSGLKRSGLDRPAPRP